jgi:hypothetical protein
MAHTAQAPKIQVLYFVKHIHGLSPSTGIKDVCLLAGTTLYTGFSHTLQKEDTSWVLASPGLLQTVMNESANVFCLSHPELILQGPQWNKV